MEHSFEKLETQYGTFYLLHCGKLTDDEYDKIKPIVEHLGGHWREKYNGFVFRKNVSDIFPYLLKTGVRITEQYSFKEKTQFYPTPKNVAKRVVELADIKDGMRVLEPSAGVGNIVDQILINCDITCVEPYTPNSKILKQKGYRTIETIFEDFAKDCGTFDRIVMNPPFSGQRDALHVMLAYSLLRNGGVLSAIVSENSLYYKTDTSDIFRNFFKTTNAKVEAVPPNAFEESGTTIDTVILQIKKI